TAPETAAAPAESSPAKPAAATSKQGAEQRAGNHIPSSSTLAPSAAAPAEKQDDRNEHDQEQQPGGLLFATALGGAVAFQRLAAEHLQHGVDTGANAPGVIALAKGRGDQVVDNQRRLRIGESAFQAIADLDADLAFVAGDNQQRAVVPVLLTDAPVAAQLDAEFLDAATLQIGHGDHHQLLAGGLFMGGKLLGQLAFAGSVQQLGLVDHSAGEWRKLDLCLHASGAQAEQQGEQQQIPPVDNGMAPLHQNCTCGACSAFSEVASKVSRIGMSLYIKVCQMRPGKVRISVL